MTALILTGIILVFIKKLLFLVESLLCRAVDLAFQMFEVFSGIEPITYKGVPNTFLNFFFENQLIQTIYMGMACIGFALAFAFAIIAVVKKFFDSTGEKMKATYSSILTNLFKSILIIMLLTAIVSATITASGRLLTAMSDIFDNAEQLANPDTIVFTDKQRAAMYRIINTIGNYTVNPGYNNRYNINACFNEIRDDMKLLEEERVFEYPYTLPAKAKINYSDLSSPISGNTTANMGITYGGYNTNPTSSWQYSLLKIYVAQDITNAVALDVYNEALTDAMVSVAERIKLDGAFVPLTDYTRIDSSYGKTSSIGRTIMLSGTMRARGGSPSLTDSIRGPFYYQDKDCYDFDSMDDTFDWDLFSIDHVVIIFVSYMVLKQMIGMLINCIARVFNIILLYIMAPPFIAVMPLDDGGKMKQWTTAFVIQTFQIFGSFVAVRLLVIFIPMVMDPQFVIFSNEFGNYMGKLVVLLGMTYTVGKAASMIGGILADNAGYQSIMAGDVGNGLAETAMSLGTSVAKGAAKMGFKAGQKALSFAADATGLTKMGNDFVKKRPALKNFLAQGSQSIKEHGLRGAWQKGFATEKSDKEKADKLATQAKDANQSEFQEKMMSLANYLTGGALGAALGGREGGGPGGPGGPGGGEGPGGNPGGGPGGNLGEMFQMPKSRPAPPLGNLGPK